MGDVAAWVFGGVGVILSILSFARTYGFDRGADAERKRYVDDTLKRLSHNDEIHFQHAKDDEAHFKDQTLHWSPNERRALDQTLTDIKADTRQLLNMMIERNGRS